MEFSVKAYLQKDDSTVEVRRIPITLEGHNIYSQMLNRITESFPGLLEKLVTLKWRDSDGDYVLMSSDEEVVEALSHCSGSPLKVYITIDAEKGDKPTSSKSENSSEAHSHNREYSEGSQEEPRGFFFTPPTSPPPPFFGPEFSCGRKRRQHGPFEGQWSFQGHPFGGQFHCRPFGGQAKCDFGPLGGHGPFGGHGIGHGPFREHGGGHGPFREHGSGHSPFGRHGPFSHGHFSGFGHGPFGSFFHYSDFGGKDQQKKKNDESGWKGKLRDAVPVSHRRWAKYYISNWRGTNLKNATTTSSDSDQEHISMENANVPETYAKWLDHILPKWHRRWNQEFSEGQDHSGDDQDKGERKRKLKDSVPKEFRKWTKWYLARHFGQKEAPKFREESDYGWRRCHGSGKKYGACGKKMWKKAYKMHFLHSSVPLKYRIWAREFIQDWRQQNKISDPVSACSSSESEEGERPQGKIVMPNDYSKWLVMFLNKWHIKRGLLEGQKVSKVEMVALKEAVPWDFRKWVKCYMWGRYWKTGREAETAPFHKKWLNEKDSNGRNLTSSDEEIATSASKKLPEVEKSFKRLRLDEQSGGQKNVSFAEEAQRQQQTPPGADSEQATLSTQNKKVNPGKSTSSDGDLSDEEIPLHPYHWMSKMMMKMQMKELKKEMKQASKERKAATKAQKYFRM